MFVDVTELEPSSTPLSFASAHRFCISSYCLLACCQYVCALRVYAHCSVELNSTISICMENAFICLSIQLCILLQFRCIVPCFSYLFFIAAKEFQIQVKCTNSPLSKVCLSKFIYIKLGTFIRILLFLHVFTVVDYIVY